MSDILHDLLVHSFRPIFYIVSPLERIHWVYLLTSFGIALIMFLRLRSGEKFSLKGLKEFLIPKGVYTHRSAINDYKIFYINAIVITLLVIPTFFYVSPLISSGVQFLLAPTGLKDCLGGGNFLSLLLYTLVFALVYDFGIFYSHYLQHKISWLWEFHKLHHSAEVLTPVTAYRMHPVDWVVGLLVTYFVVGMMEGLYEFFYQSHVSTVGLYGLDFVTLGFYLFGYNLRHSHIWVDYGPFWSRIFMSPAQHQIHHSAEPRHFDTNMGFVFAFWDAMTRTLYVPKTHETFEYGIGSREQQRDFYKTWDCYIRPFRNAYHGLEDRRLLRATLSMVGIAFAAACLLQAIKGPPQLSPAVAAPQHSSPARQEVKDLISGDPAQKSVYLEDLTWPEVRTLIRDGHTIAIVPTGGTEQNGPHMILGKHNYIVHKTAGEIARQLGNALVAPVIAYVPEGKIDPPDGHMPYAGTLSLPDDVFEALLENTARSLKTHGFTAICFLGDSGWNIRAQEHVAQKLNAEWQGQGVRVLNVNDYYEHNGQMDWLKGQGESEETIGTHAGIRDTSELMVVHPEGIRSDLTKKESGRKAFHRTGVAGDPTRASAARGKVLLNLKVEAAVRQIRKELKEPSDI